MVIEILCFGCDGVQVFGKFSAVRRQRFVADVFAAPGALPANFLDGSVGLQFGFADAVADRGDAQDAAARVDDLTIDGVGAGMKDFDVGKGIGRVQAFDFTVFFVVARITFAGHHDAQTRPIIPFQPVDLTESAVDGRFDHVDDVRFQTHQQRLAFGVTEADIEFENLRSGGRQHQPGVQHALERSTRTFHGVNDRHQDVRFDFRHQFFVDDGRRTVRPHSSGVWTCVAVIGGLVILSRRQRDDGFAVGDRQHAGLLAGQSFLDDQFGAGIAEFALVGDAVDRFEGFAAGAANDDAFAGGQAVGFDHHGDFVGRFAVAVFDVTRRVTGVTKGSVVCGRDVGRVQQVFAKHLAALQLRGGFGRSEHPQAFGLHRIDDAHHQGSFRADDDQVDLFAFAKTDQAVDVGRGDRDVDGVASRPRVARRHENGFDTRTLADFPSQGVFTATAADD